MSCKYRFILIDDVQVNNLLTQLIIERGYPGCNIVQFTDALDALQHIRQEYSGGAIEGQTILLLDIYMPVTDGWAFLEQFEQMNDEIKSKIKVWLLSSSISSADRARSAANARILGFVLKPFTQVKLSEVLANPALKEA